MESWHRGVGEMGMLNREVGACKSLGLPCPQLSLAGAPGVAGLWPGAEAFRLAAR